MARDRYVPTYDGPPLPPAGRPTYEPGPTSPEPPPRSPPPGFPGDGPPPCEPGQLSGCRPSVPPPPTSLPAEQQRQVEAAIAANFPKPKGKVRRENVPRKVAKGNLDAFRLGVVNPAAQMVLDAAKAVGQQIAEEGLKVLFGKIFKVGKVVKGTEIVLKIAEGAEEELLKKNPAYRDRRAELSDTVRRLLTPKLSPAKQAKLERIAVKKGYQIPKPVPPPAQAKPAPPRPAPAVPRSKPSAGFSTRYAAPVTVPGVQALPRPAPAPAKPAARPVAAPARPVAAPARPGSPLPRQAPATATRPPSPKPASRPTPRMPTRPASQPVPRPIPSPKPSSRPSPIGRVLASLPAPAQFVRPPRAAPRPAAPRPFTPPLTSLQSPVLPLTASGFPPNRPPTKTKECRCDESKKPRKKRPPRTVCYRGTYTETARGLIKTRKERIECPPSKSK